MKNEPGQKQNLRGSSPQRDSSYDGGHGPQGIRSIAQTPDGQPENQAPGEQQTMHAAPPPVAGISEKPSDGNSPQDVGGESGTA